MFQDQTQTGQQPAQPYPSMPFLPNLNVPSADPTLQRWLIDLDSNIEEITLVLAGYIYDYKQEKWIKDEKRVKPLLNEEGINWIKNILYAYRSKNMQFTFFDKQEISNITLHLSRDLNIQLGICKDLFQIKAENLDIISNIVMDSIYAVLKKADEGKLMKFLRDTSTLSQIQSLTSQEKKAGMFSKLFSMWK
jgi:hypothetical protein